MKASSRAGRTRAIATLFAVLLAAMSFGGVLSIAQAAGPPIIVNVTVSVTDKTYDGFSDASVVLSSVNFVPGDDVNVYYTGTATFSDRNVGAGKAVTVTGLALGGANASKYQLAATTATGVGSITPANLTISAVTDTRVYNGTTSSTGVPTVSGIVGTDTVDGLAQTFNTKDVGSRTLSVSAYAIHDGNAGGNYTVILGQDFTGVITPRTLTITAAPDSKPYDGTVASAATPNVVGLVGVDTVTGLVQEYDTKFVGTGKTLTVLPGYSVNDDFGGADYNVVVHAISTGIITPAPLTITGAVAASKTYDGTATASVTGGVLSGVLPGETASIGTYKAAFNNKNVGVAKPVTVTGVTLTGADAANYMVSPMPAGLTADITGRTLTISGAVAANKAYDGTVTAGVSGGSLAGVLPGDTVAIGTYAAAFADPAVGTGKPVTVTGVTLTGADAGNYSVSPLPSGLTANITVRSLTITGASAANKTYDATVTASVTGGSLVGVVSGESVGIGVYTATFNTKSAGTAKPVTVSAVTLTGADAGNYVVSPMPSGITADIAARSLTITGAVAANKTYDGTATAGASGGSLVGVLPGDTAGIGAYTAVFDTKNIGTAKPITVLAVALTGADAGNYTVTPLPAGLSADVTAKSLTITGAAAANKAYDGTVTASVTGGSLVGVASGDSVAVGVYTASFADPDVGTAKPVTVAGVTLTGGDAGNYLVSPLPTGLTANIGAASLTVTGASASNKVYDGTAVASVTGGSLVGAIPGDAVSIGTYAAAFNNKNVGIAKSVTVTSVSLTGANAGNYVVSPMPSGLTADITPISVALTGASAADKSYDGTVTASVSGGSLVWLASGDNVAIGVFTASFNNKNVGSGKPVTVTGVTLTGTDAANYVVSPMPSGLTASITAKSLTITGASAADKSYDGTTLASVTGGSLVGVVPGDTVAIGVYTAAFADASAGPGKPVTVSAVTLTGADQGNYTVSPLPSGLTARIIGTPLTITGAVAADKTYDGTITASVSGGSLVGVFPGDTVAIGTYTAAFANRNVGTAKPVTVLGVTLTGTDAASYEVQPLPTGLTANISAKDLSITAVADTKVYDGGTSSVGVPTVSGLVGGDTVTGLVQAFDTKNVGTGKTLSLTQAQVVDGNGGLNYTVVPHDSTAGVISAKPLTISGAGAAGKVYDGTNTASVSGGSLSGVISPDVVAIGTYTATFSDKNVGSKAVTVSGVTLTGAGAGNYSVSPMPTVANATISAKALTVSGANAAGRVYNGTDTASVSGGSLAGIIAPDSVSIGSYTATFANKHVGSAKAVTVSAVSLTGTSAGNYTVTSMPVGLTADITAAPLTITAATDSKVYDGTTSSSATPTVAGLVGGDTVTNMQQTFDTKDWGIGKTLTVTGYTVNDGNSGNDYGVTTFQNVTGSISRRAVTVTANSTQKTRGATLTFAGTEFTHGALVTGDDITAISLSSLGATSGAAAGVYPIVGAYPISGAGAANYDVTFVDGTLTVVAVPTTKLLLTVRFTHTGTTVTSAWKTKLHSLASSIKANGYRSLTITGYTEKVPGGTLASRKRLSLLRARAVRTYLLGELAKLHYSVSIAAVGTAGPGGKTYTYPRAEVVATNVMR